MTENDVIKEAENKIPVGWSICFIAVVVWLIWYIYAYTPEITGWSYYTGFEEDMKAQAEAPQVILTENPYEQDKKAIEEGKLIYASACGVCHGDDLKGNVGAGPDLTAHLRYGETDDKKFESIAKGRPNGMPPFERQLGREKIWKVLAYVDSVREYGEKP